MNEEIETEEAQELFNGMAMSAMQDLGLPEDEAENMLEDYHMGF